jgi:sugar O-acyltransferase (sialic acid O-acetyltransferase NeuD family)
MRTILIVGAGGHARACIDVIEQAGDFSVAGLVGRPEERGRRVLGYPVLGTDDELATVAARIGHALVAVGQIKTAEIRARLFGTLEGCGCGLPTIISPRAYASPHARIGAGTILMHGAVVNAGAEVGRNCIINSQALVEHDSVIGDHCHVATGAAVNSGVVVGARTFIGSHATIRQSVRIGEGCVIGMGEHVRDHCEAGAWVAPGRAR